MKSNVSFLGIEFVDEWMGVPPGTKMSISEPKARELISRNVAKLVEEEKVEKSIDAPPMNKMMAAAPVKKAGRPKLNK